MLQMLELVVPFGFPTVSLDAGSDLDVHRSIARKRFRFPLE
jgi:hypothetical protein